LVDNIIKGEKYRRANYNSESSDRVSIMNLYDPYKDYFVPRDPNLYTVD
jgi:hypothetical protein